MLANLPSAKASHMARFKFNVTLVGVVGVGGVGEVKGLSKKEKERERTHGHGQ